MPLKTPSRLLRDAVGRTMLTPALRLMRAQMKLISDPVHLREMAARVDALGRPERDVRTERSRRHAPDLGRRQGRAP
jgi:hypothetical protein